MWIVIFLVLAVASVLFVLTQFVQTSTPSREQKMVALDAAPASSYRQTTNHFQMTPVNFGAVSGFETPFRVNMYQAYMEA
jgi:uncharacterized protein YpmB